MTSSFAGFDTKFHVFLFAFDEEKLILRARVSLLFYVVGKKEEKERGQGTPFHCFFRFDDDDDEK